ncbi:30S ribosomal protein S6e [Candidatus Woesearchaeota archaeon]|nr:30S ribosomal protein S6e [Candidatus Woesearchaeota archaeon]
MAQFKVVIADPKSGKAVQKEVKDNEAASFIGLKLGDKVKGEILDLTGYEFEITGGSDYCGVPMRKDVPGTGRKKIYAVQGVGLKRKIVITKKGERKIRRKSHGIKQRKLVNGNTIHDKTAQINVKVLKHGSTPLFTEKNL